MARGKECDQHYWLDLISDTLKQLDVSVQGAFLQKFLQSLVGSEVSEQESVTHWRGILSRQIHLMEKVGRSVTLTTAAVDYLGELGILRNPVVLEYEELKKLRRNAATDPLTGLANRRILEDLLDQEIGRSTRYKYSFALVCLDLRYFKRVNDTYGHAIGDDVLRCVARASIETVRGSDIPCRTGGDEFAVLLPQAERRGSEVLAERIARKFEAYARSLTPATPIGIDYGIAVFPEDGRDAASLLTAADQILYANKQKAHEQSADPHHTLVLPTQEPARPLEVEDAPRGDQHPFYPSGPAATSRPGGNVHRSQNGLDGRRFERIRLEGPATFGVVRVGGTDHNVKVLDVSRAGVGLLVDQADLPDTFQALLQLPMLPGEEFTLHRIYSLPLPEGKRRIGCVLTSLCSA